MTEERKHAILFSATILAARSKLHEIGAKPCPARASAIADAVENAKRILEKIDERWPTKSPA